MDPGTKKNNVRPTFRIVSGGRQSFPDRRDGRSVRVEGASAYFVFALFLSEVAISGREGARNGPMKQKNKGMSFDGWLHEEGIREEVTAVAIRCVLARQVAAAMRRDGVTKTEMAQRLCTSRGTLDHLLDAENGSVALSTLCKAASAVGREVCLDLV